MEIKPTKLRLSKLNITKLRELLNTCPLEEKANIEKRIKVLQDKNRAKKIINPWSDNSSKSSVEEIPIPEQPRNTVDINTATRMLREYYASKFGKGPVNNVNKKMTPVEIPFEEPLPKPKKVEDVGLLATLDKDYEVVEITIKLLKKI